MRRAIRGVVSAGAVVLAGAVLPAHVAAQGGPPASVTVAPADVVFPTPGDLDFDMGWVAQGGVAVTVDPRNQRRPNWQLFVRGTAADMGGYGKPVQDILVRVQGSTAWVPLSTTEVLVAEGSGTGTVTLYFRLLLDWTLDAPGAYAVPLEYSATTF